MLPACTTGQNVYQAISPFNAAPYPSYVGDDVGGVCALIAATSPSGTYVSSLGSGSCVLSNAPYVYPVVRVCEPPTKSPFTMTLADGIQLSGLVIAVWVSAAIFRWLVRALGDKGETE